MSSLFRVKITNIETGVVAEQDDALPVEEVLQLFDRYDYAHNGRVHNGYTELSTRYASTVLMTGLEQSVQNHQDFSGGSFNG